MLVGSLPSHQRLASVANIDIDRRNGPPLRSQYRIESAIQSIQRCYPSTADLWRTHKNRGPQRCAFCSLTFTGGPPRFIFHFSLYQKVPPPESGDKLARSMGEELRVDGCGSHHHHLSPFSVGTIHTAMCGLLTSTHLRLHHWNCPAQHTHTAQLAHKPNNRLCHCILFQWTTAPLPGVCENRPFSCPSNRRVRRTKHTKLFAVQFHFSLWC